MLFVEVEGQNAGRLRHWLDTNNYVVRATFSMYADIVNNFCLPIGWGRTGHSMTSSGLRLMARYCALRLRGAGRRFRLVVQSSGCALPAQASFGAHLYCAVGPTHAR
jgi:hypothetical protein